MMRLNLILEEFRKKNIIDDKSFEIYSQKVTKIDIYYRYRYGCCLEQVIISCLLLDCILYVLDSVGQCKDCESDIYELLNKLDDISLLGFKYEGYLDCNFFDKEFVVWRCKISLIINKLKRLEKNNLTKYCHINDDNNLGLVTNKVGSTNNQNKNKKSNNPVTWDTTNEEELIKDFLNENEDLLNELTEKNNSLYWVDPYLCDAESNTEDTSRFINFINNLINEFNLKEIKLICAKKRDSEKYFNDIKERVDNQNKEVTFTCEFQNQEELHDRFWIFNEQSVYIISGSYNMFGKYNIIFAKLNKKDAKRIFAIYVKNEKEKMYYSE